MKYFSLSLMIPYAGTQQDSVPAPGDSFSCLIERECGDQTKQSLKPFH